MSDAGTIDLTDRIGERLRMPGAAGQWPDDVSRVNRLKQIRLHGWGLDIGCSDGDVIAQWLAVWPTARAVVTDTRDMSAQVLQAGELNDVSARMRFRQHWDTVQRKFEWVTCTEVIEHLYPSEGIELLQKAKERSLKRAQFIITVPNRCFTDTTRERWSWPDHKQYFSPSSLKTYLGRLFGSVSVEPMVDGIWLLAIAKGSRK